MKNAKLILIALAIALAVLLATAAIWAVVGIVTTIVKFLLVLAVILFAVLVFRKLSGKSKPGQLEEKYEDRELNEAMRQLEELKRGQRLTK